MENRDFLTEYYDFIQICEIHDILVLSPERGTSRKPARNKDYEHKSYHLIILPDNKLIRVKRSNRDRSGHMQLFYKMLEGYPAVQLEVDKLKACWMGFNIEWSAGCDDIYYTSISVYLEAMEEERNAAQRRKDEVRERRSRLPVLRLP